MRVAIHICHAYTKKKLSSFNVEDDEKNVSDSLLMSMSQVEFMILHVLCIC